MRMIDADALKKAMDGYWGICQRIRKPRNGETAVFLDVKATVEKQPTIDAVPVIRCKDCKFSMSGIDKYNERYILCQLHERSYGVIDDGFCKWAERKEE